LLFDGQAIWCDAAVTEFHCPAAKASTSEDRYGDGQQARCVSPNQDPNFIGYPKSLQQRVYRNSQYSYKDLSGDQCHRHGQPLIKLGFYLV
jgi:hypothetical protein